MLHFRLELRLSAGSIERAFSQEFSSEIETIMNNIRAHRIGIRNLPLMHPELPAILTKAQAQGFPVAMYLTTRPDAFTDITTVELARNNLPKRPIIARPPTIPREKTTQWKLGILTELADKSPHGIIMVDDSAGLSQAIQSLNKLNLHSILIAGPITSANSTAITWGKFTDHLQTFS